MFFHFQREGDSEPKMPYELVPDLGARVFSLARAEMGVRAILPVSGAGLPVGQQTRDLYWSTKKGIAHNVAIKLFVDLVDTQRILN